MRVTSNSQPSTASTAVPAPATLTLDIGGMKCAGCVKTVETQLTQQAGVLKATVNLVTEMALVDYQPDCVDAHALAHTLTEAGFPSTVRWTSQGEDSVAPAATLAPAETQRLETQRQFRQVAIAAVLLLCSLMGHLQHFGWTMPILSSIGFHGAIATLALVGPGRPILVEGWQGLRRNAPNMNTLVGLGTITAYSTSVVALLWPSLGWDCFFDEPVMLLGFILLGRALEQRARGQAAEAFQALLALQPAIARLIQQPNAVMASHPGATGEEQTHRLLLSPVIELPADQIKPGDYLKVLPGDQIPVDGEVAVGQTTINESMLTGESAAVLKRVGDPVSAGSLNQSGAIALRATRTGRDTTLSQMIALVETAQTRKAPIQTLADWVAGYFTYGVLTLATLTFLFWYFVGSSLWPDVLAQAVHPMLHATAPVPGTGMAPPAPQVMPLLFSLKRAIAVLVIACPCALGLATPTAILVGSGMGAERGILIRGGDVLETVHRLTTVVFDKTGTLTTGQPSVTDCLSLSDRYPPTALLQLAATVEQGTNHPVAIAITDRAAQEGLTRLSASDFYTEPGLGVSARVEGHLVVLGGPGWLKQQSVDVTEAAATVPALAADGKTVIYVAVDGQLVGLLATQDTIRADAQATVQRLQQMGLSVVLMTGDQHPAALAVAQAAGIPEAQVFANQLPTAKATAIAARQSQGERVAMVGDGMNDSPALVQADVSIALHSGTQAAIEAADIVLMGDRLSDVVRSIQLSKATVHKIQQNLFWAFAYNMVGIPAAAGLFLPAFDMALSPALAGALMALSSVSVVTNSLLLKRALPYNEA